LLGPGSGAGQSPADGHASVGTFGPGRGRGDRGDCRQWLPEGTPGSHLSFLGAPYLGLGSALPRLAPKDRSLRPSPVGSGPLRLAPALSGQLRPSRALSGQLRPSPVSFGPLGSSSVGSGPLRLAPGPLRLAVHLVHPPRPLTGWSGPPRADRCCLCVAGVAPDEPTGPSSASPPGLGVASGAEDEQWSRAPARHSGCLARGDECRR
jgi:hypothetical protein